MPELCDPKCQFSTLLIFELMRLCSFILSHPLYFSYFVFFSPYLLKLVSFLSPLFVTTFLLFLTFLAGFVPHHPQTRLSSILEGLQFKKDSPNAELHLSDDLGMYETLFGPSPVAAITETEQSHVDENKVSPKVESTCVVMEEKRLENFFKILDEFERLASNVDEMKRSAKSNKAVEKLKPPLVHGSDAAAAFRSNSNNSNKSNDIALKLGCVEEFSSMAKSHSQRITTSTTESDDSKLKFRAESCVDARNNLSRYGSMRKEREWERTLACKLYEERHNVGAAPGGEGMDSLWEAYEAEDFVVSRSQVGRRKKREEALERECEEEDEEIGGQLCCLQALKLSAGKMVLGVGKPNLVKISKAIKGFGWLHKSSKSSKKVHNHHGGDRRY